MFEQISPLQQVGLTVLAAAGAVWAVRLVRMLHRDRTEPTLPYVSGASLHAVPRQPSHAGETVELSAAERDAFADLVRQLMSRRG
ncbi:hypothetical protein [Streptomyces luteolus]|uniref:Secreted protein n=1 Tax=Streptomyces luteolus TaxID=3043615 RepID=A0ABT6T3Z5_9ACTN|nr:hypothetical protein [Streptomyces sp. B-S-A12]MDI3421779.1 hypothetical protein [Streptomyces sp. B-S-A12]